jgi:hypothetical protein
MSTIMDLVKQHREKDKMMEMDSAGWVKWSGGMCPVNPDYTVQTRYRNMLDTAKAKDINWGYAMSYRVIGIGDTGISENRSDGSTAKYYELPRGATELQHLISAKDMNAQIGEIFRSCYRYGHASHSDKLRDAKKIKFYIEAEIERLEKQK